MSVCAVVVRYRGGDEVGRCLESLTGQVDDLVLVDSGSGDGGAAFLARRFPEVRVIELEENLGFAISCNRGVASTEADLILLANPDTVFPPGSVAALVAGLEQHPETAGVVPLLVDSAGTPQLEWQLRLLPRAFDLHLGRSGPPAFSGTPEEPKPVEQPAAACWLLSASTWKSLEGFDEAFRPAWWEDVDFCVRLASVAPSLDFEHGFLLLPDIQVGHLGGSSLATVDRRSFKAIFRRNLLIFCQKHHPMVLPLVTLTTWLKSKIR